jgi:DNA (cytosine-5)-methyltransferase 1
MKLPSFIPKHLNFIDLFAGAGGLSCGLELAGHRCLLGVDADQYAMHTFALNHKYAETYSHDIAGLDLDTIKNLTGRKTIHVVVGGPPCQGFSTAGLGNPLDQRNALFRHFVRIVKDVRPWFVIMENVTGLLAKKNAPVLKAILQEFQKLGYNMDVRVLSSEEYGVPERRRRTVFIGSNITNTILFPETTHGLDEGKAPLETVGHAFKRLEKELKSKTKEIPNHNLPLTVIKNPLDRERLHYIPEGKGIRYQKDEEEYLPKHLRLGVKWHEIPEERFRQTRLQRLDRKKPSITITTQKTCYYHPTEDRYLSAREAATLQSFPHDYIFIGSDRAQWRQIGNAVPPLLGKALGINLNRMLERAYLENPDFLQENFDSLLNPKKSRNKVARKIEKNIDTIRSKAFVYNHHKTDKS